MTVTDIVANKEHAVQVRKVTDDEFNEPVADDMVVRIAEIEVYPQHLEQYLELAVEIQRASLQKEPGVVCLFPCQISGEPSTIRIVEIYRSQQAYQSHITTEHFMRYKKATSHMVKSLKLVDITPIDKENMIKIFKRF